jgi:hypothetical protein
MEDPFVSGKPIALVLALVLIGAALFKWWPSDERAIMRQLDALADTLTVPSTDTDLSRITRLAELRNYLAPDVRVRIGGLYLISREAVMSAAERWTPPPGGVFVSFTDVAIERAGESARISLTMKVTSRDRATGEETVDGRDVHVGMAKQNDDWVVTSLEPIEASEQARPGTP